MDFNLLRFCVYSLVLNLCGLAFVPRVYAVDKFVINHSVSESDQRYQYTYELLDLIINETNADFGDASIEVTNLVMSRNRIFRSLQDGQTINVMAEASNEQWNTKLIPIPIPIRKGIQGLRVFIIKNENKDLLANISSLEQLMMLQTGSGSQWSTRVAMKQAGFNVVESAQYDSLFNMLSKRRFVTFGRGVNEAYQEVELFQKLYPELIVDEHIVLNIPLATYYYVSPKKPRLAKRIKIGLLRMIENGKFDQLFYRWHCECLIRSLLNKRQLFKITNPLVVESQMTSIMGEDFLFNPSLDISSICEKYLE
ncbi:hypothetical protein [Shewanella livingstonensis]|uniref:Solute-binding protein family 3/N-terminal domain-containing protein n=1 Tax=Shewanella livingstonensis TaxID=150120 RepID=A0A3G8LP44_9GAMM|nr:hypothetical protein [Shewanella livingstonensis]AZG71553.1 hypothetical protein EGC82_01465 [Shewanella livingstonensis]